MMELEPCMTVNLLSQHIDSSICQFRESVANFELIIKHESRKTIYLLNYRTEGKI